MTDDPLYDQFEGDFERIRQARTHHPDSPEGPAIAECEREVLDRKVLMLPLGRVA